MANRRKSTQIKIAQDTLRKCRELKNEMLPMKFEGIPITPDLLKKNKRAIKIWNESVKCLFDLNMLHGVDFPMLAAYCLEMAIYFEMQERIQSYDTIDKLVQKDEMRIAGAALDRALKLAAQFGFTPAARTKISMPGKKDEGMADEIFDK